MKKYQINIEGMTCAACSSAIERTVGKQPGVSDVIVNLPLKQALVWFDETLIDEKTIDQKIDKLGYRVVEDRTVLDGKKQLASQRNRMILALILMVFLLGITMIPMTMKLDIFKLEDKPVLNTVLQFILSLAIMTLGNNFYRKGFRGLISLNANMDSLIAVGTSVAFLYSLSLSIMIFGGDIHQVHNLYYESAGVIVALVMLGKYLEARSNRKTSEALESLMDLTPEQVWLKDENGQLEKPIELIKPKQVLIVKAGDKIPLDGILSKGETTVDQSLLSGESLPIDKKVGDDLISGSINLSGAIEMTVTKDCYNSTVANLVKLMEEAQLAKAPIAKLADKIAAFFVPLIGILAFVSAVVWYLLTGDFGFSLKIMIGIMVIACPCALGLATPTAIMVATGAAAKQGILFKNGEALQKAGNIDTIVFDKTGTLTSGNLTIDKITSTIDREELLQLTASLETFSNHPFAKVIVEANKKDLAEVTELREYAGKGLSGKIGERLILAGNAKLLADHKIMIPAFKDEDNSSLYVAIDGQPVAAITLKDQIRVDSKEALERLKKRKLSLYLLSGDSKKITAALADDLKIDYFAEVLPQDKAQIIKELQSRGKNVAFVGDGINDAIALTCADLGIAIGSGSDVALKSGEVVLVNSRIHDVESILNIGRKTMLNIKENLFWAFFYNSLGIPLAMGLFIKQGYYIDPMFGALAMSLSSVCVVTNALRLRKL